MGIFRLKMQPDGNLVQYPMGTSDEVAYAYFTYGTDGRGDNVMQNLDADNRLCLLNATGSTIKNLINGGYPTEETIYLMRIDTDGIFRLYLYKLKQNIGNGQSYGHLRMICVIPRVSVE